MRQQMTAKNPTNYETERKEVHKFEQKPINFNEFSDAEESEVKARAEKRNAIKREKAEDAKAKKLKLKEKENKLENKKDKCGIDLMNSTVSSRK